MNLKSLLFCAVVCGALLSPVHAQTTPNTAQKSGYELLVEAGTKVSPDYHVYDKIPADEKLRLERAVVARNAPALATLREALRAGISVPTAKTYSDTMNFSLNARTREMARQLAIESDVRFADGDFAGAMNSKLDALEFSVQFGRGSLLKGLVGVAVESIGRTDFEKVAAHLDAPQCRAAAARLASIEAGRAPFAQIVEQESQESQTLLLSILPNVQKEIQTPSVAKANDYSPQQVAQIEALTPDRLRSDTQTFFAPIIARASQPYSSTLAPLPLAPNPLLAGKEELFNKTRLRFGFERGRTFNLLLQSALGLRAQKKERGAYPDTFQTPLDPFSPDSSPLVYKKTATGYLLYSVGPDGKDNGGADIQTIEVGELNGVKSISDKLRPDSFGDLVQKPF